MYYIYHKGQHCLQAGRTVVSESINEDLENGDWERYAFTNEQEAIDIYQERFKYLDSVTFTPNVAYKMKCVRNAMSFWPWVESECRKEN